VAVPQQGEGVVERLVGQRVERDDLDVHSGQRASSAYPVRWRNCSAITSGYGVEYRLPAVVTRMPWSPVFRGKRILRHRVIVMDPGVRIYALTTRTPRC
jgi:hypothetical protein